MMGRDRSLADWHAPILPFAMVLLGAAMGASPVAPPTGFTRIFDGRTTKG